MMNTTQETTQANTALMNEAEHKERYWSQLLTGDLDALPAEVRSRIEAGRGFGGNDAERLSRAVMQSWVADMGNIPGEQIRKNWAHIRRNVGKQYGVNSDSDHELYMAVSLQNQVKRSQRQQLLTLYHDTYARHLVNDEQAGMPTEAFDDELKDKAVQVYEKARREALSDKTRLQTKVAILKRALEWFEAVENPQHDGPGPVTVFHVNRRAVERTDEVWRAATMLNETSESDKQKLWYMISPKPSDAESLRQLFNKSLRRGVMNAGSGMAQALAHGAVAIMPDGEFGKNIDRYAQSVKVLQDFANSEFAPLNADKNDTWLRRFIADVGQQGANAALAFCGPIGLGALALEEIGHSMANERAQNPEMSHSVQMNTALATGVANAALSIGLNRLGNKLLGNEIKAFRAMQVPGDKTMREFAKDALVTLGRETAEELVENKSTELSSMLIKEVAHTLTGQITAPDWQAWADKQTDVKQLLYEAAVMMPLLLIGAGKTTLSHYRHPQHVLHGGAPLRILGVPEESIRTILAESDTEKAGQLLKQALQNSPMWGSLYISRKAMEWSRILGEDGQPLLRTEQEVCDFLDMQPALRTNAWKAKQFPEAEAKLAELRGNADFMAARVGWLMRAGLPRVEDYLNAGGETKYRAIPDAESDFTAVKGAHSLEAALAKWNEEQEIQESRDLALLSQRDDLLPEKLVQGAVFDTHTEALQQAFLEERLRQIAWRPARLLLLTYPEELAGSLNKSPQEWETLTEKTDRELRANVAEGVLEMLYGESHETVQNHVAERFWSQFCKDKHGKSLAKKLLAEGKHHLREPQNANSENRGLIADLVRVGRKIRELSISERENGTDEWVAINRLLWGVQADVMAFHQLLPNMKEFDAGVARGYMAQEIFGSLLAKYLDISEENLRENFRHLTAEKLQTMTNAREAKKYADTAEIVGNLTQLDPGAIQQTEHGGEPLWRAHYPDGNWSVWHKTREAAETDLAAHVYMVMTSYQYPKWMMVKWWNKKLLADDMDATHLRMREESLFGPDEKRLPGPYEYLSRIATHDLIQLDYGKRGMLTAGEEFLMLDKGRSTADITMLAPEAQRERKKLAEVYEAMPDNALMGVDAYNEPIIAADGTVRSRMVLNNVASPIAVLEDKAEVVWDRLMRTGQLPLKSAVAYLQSLGRFPKSSRKLTPMRVIEELSQLSKEYYFAHRNAPIVPKSMRIWFKYSCALPQRANENLGELVRRSKQIVQNLASVDASFTEMIKESVGMNEAVRAERHWVPAGVPGLAMMERFYHSLRAGDLLDKVPPYVAVDLVKKLGKSATNPEGDESLARQKISELAAQLRENAQLVYWRPEPGNPEKYQYLMPKKHDYLLKNKALPRLKGRKLYRELEKSMPELPQPPGEVRDEFVLRTNLDLPKTWKNKTQAKRALETLEQIRRDFADRPVATEQGIFWQGRLYNSSGEARPAGVGVDWAVRTPLQEVLPKHRQMEHMVLTGQGYPRIADLGLAPDEALLAGLTCNAVYIDPLDESHTIRLMSGAPDSAVPELQLPYVIHVWNGVYLDVHGNAAASEKARYIPLEQFSGATKMPTPEQMEQARRKEREQILLAMADPARQKKRWLSRKHGVSSFFEDSVRLSEDLGMGELLATDSLSPVDDVVMATLNLLGYAIKHPSLMNWEWKVSTQARSLLSGRVKEFLEVLKAYETE